jgi:hypothetical protein
VDDYRAPVGVYFCERKFLSADFVAQVASDLLFGIASSGAGIDTGGCILRGNRI